MSREEEPDNKVRISRETGRKLRAVGGAELTDEQARKAAEKVAKALRAKNEEGKD